ncbi:surfactin synthase thioesterase subunit [Catenulispora sp. EB89]|uniref:thioesterase II family protein n=1 Tax=Catenulispora sp. EB89 TaxID=3156257 RepID=UPI00351528F1
MSSSRQDTTVVKQRRLPNPARTLACLGFCGGGSGAFHAWLDVLPPGVELATICYPGREGRHSEEFATDWDALADDTTQAVLAVAAEGPYVLFGHSMGAWMAFDVTARVEQAGSRPPEFLLVSSANAPSAGLRSRDMFPAQQETDQQLLEWMRTYGLIPDYALEDPDLVEMAVELMRADIKVRDTFHYTAGTRIRTPLHVLTGSEDTTIEADAGKRWEALARGAFRHDVLPGGHFYTPEIWRRLPAFVATLAADDATAANAANAADADG